MIEELEDLPEDEEVILVLANIQMFQQILWFDYVV